MINHISDYKLTRRQFLISGGKTITGIALACSYSYDRTKPASEVQRTDIYRNIRPIQRINLPTVSTPEKAADLILTNGKIFTVDNNNTITQAVAIKNGMIQGTGKSEEIEQLTGTSTQVLDLAGRGVTPGFIDPHHHHRLIGMMTSYYIPFMPPEVTSIATLQQALKKYIATKKPGDWIMAYYMSLQDNPYPTKADLDPVSPDNPLFIMHIGGHWATANSAALKAAGITASTPSPSGGLISIDAAGQPTGQLYNHRAMDMVRRYAPLFTDAMMRQYILDAQAQVLASGITTVQDNNIRLTDDVKVYQELSQSGKLILRNNLFLTMEYPQDLQSRIKVKVLQNKITRFSGYKFLLDGQLPTAYCHEPHNGTAWNVSTWDVKSFRNAVRTLHDTGLQICVHCVGDAASDMALDAFEAAMNANPRPDPRHRLEHAVLTTPAATQRIKDLGVVVSVTPLFICMAGDMYGDILGEERTKRVMVTREWLENGIHLTVGSDTPTTPWYTPQATMAAAIMRPTPSKKILNKEQCLTFSEALRGFTIEAAYASRQENEKGSLEAGKLADLAVWPCDPSTLQTSTLRNLEEMDMTILGGKVVHGIISGA